MTSQIDFTISAKLQACALNFDRWITKLFGQNFALKGNLKVAIQFSGFDLRQKGGILSNPTLPENIASAIEDFEGELDKDQFNDPTYSYRAIFVRKVSWSKTGADEVIEFIPASDERANEINSVYLKEVDKRRMRPSKIVDIMKLEGFENFNIRDHTILWQSLDAQRPAKGFGVATDDGWRWYDRWLDTVRQHCEENRDKYILV